MDGKESKENTLPWYTRWPDRLNREKYEFSRDYPELKLVTLENRQLMWVGPIRSNSGRQYIIQILYPECYPYDSPTVYPVSIDREDIVSKGRVARSHECHIMPDGSLCFAFPSFSFSHATAVILANMAVFWLSGFEHFIEKGTFEPDYEILSDARELFKPNIMHSTAIYVDKTTGDINIASQAGAVGSNSRSYDNEFNQIGSVITTDDLPRLTTQLSQLRQAMLHRATSLDHFEAIGAIASAEKAVQEGNGNKATQFLKKAGKWAIDTATDIGFDVVAEVIKKSTGLP